MQLKIAVDWLLTSISGSHTHELSPWIYWHARLMVLSWSMLLPIGMLAARFTKIIPGQKWPQELDNKFWWRTHLGLQVGGIAIMSLGLILAIAGPNFSQGRMFYVHVLIGWLVVGIGWVQILSGLLRGSKGGPTDICIGGDHYEMTLRRVIFEYVHKSLGWLALPFAWIVTGFGLVVADAPRWMAVVLGIWWFGVALIFVVLQIKGYCVDTYEAIWGPDIGHPGNRRRPIGFGIKKKR